MEQEFTSSPKYCLISASCVECFKAWAGNPAFRSSKRKFLTILPPQTTKNLGELYKDQKEFAKAREAFTNAITARSDSVYTFYYRAQASLGLGDFAAAIPDLERVVGSDAKFDYYRAAGLLADACARTGQLERAEHFYAEVTQFSTTTETLYNYACFLKLAGRREEAREWAQKLLAKKRTLPRYMQRYERPWFRKGKTLLKELELAPVK